jgi:amino acid adenylation domain-containing protein
MTSTQANLAICTDGHFDSRTIPEVVTALAAESPHTVALAAGEQSLTYQELDCRANRLARYLRSLGIGPDVLVGLCLPRSLDMVVGALGIWKAGGAYVPMDPAYPPDRLAFMLDDAQAPVLVSQACLAQLLPPLKQKLVNIGVPEVSGQSADPPAVDIRQSNLAYVIYTSGSTGAPKGVEITHRSLANLVSWHRWAFSVTSADRASHLAGLGFDAAVWELWPYLAAGASVHMADELTRNSAELLRDWLLAQRITISFVPTPLTERLLTLEWPRHSPLRILLTGGDRLHHYPPENLPFALVNNYGPTECTVVATSGTVSAGMQPDALPPIGRPIANTQIYLLNERLENAPAGTINEIHIAGASLARGYHNRPDLTAKQFIPNPFSSEPDSKLYKTGDLARLLPDGQIAFVGRVDDQIKIRGYRIEPSEIERELNRRPDILDSLVVAREDTPGDKRLVAYVRLSPDSCETHAALREFLRRSLPEYMLPAVFVRIETFPLTPHGKIDRDAFPPPDPANTLQDEVSASPRTLTEQRIAEMLTGLLGLGQIGRDDNFFMMGGHSLLGAQLIARLRETFGVQIELRNLFGAPTVATLSAEVERLAVNGEKSARPLPTPASAMASSCGEKNA